MPPCEREYYGTGYESFGVASEWSRRRRQARGILGARRIRRLGVAEASVRPVAAIRSSVEGEEAGVDGGHVDPWSSIDDGRVARGVTAACGSHVTRA